MSTKIDGLNEKAQGVLNKAIEMYERGPNTPLDTVLKVVRQSHVIDTLNNTEEENTMRQYLEGIFFTGLRVRDALCQAKTACNRGGGDNSRCKFFGVGSP